MKGLEISGFFHQRKSFQLRFIAESWQVLWLAKEPQHDDFGEDDGTERASN